MLTSLDVAENLAQAFRAWVISQGIDAREDAGALELLHDKAQALTYDQRQWLNQFITLWQMTI